MYLALALTPFIQLGVSYWLSVQSIAVGTLAVVYRRELLVIRPGQMLIGLFLCATALISVFAIRQPDDLTHDILRVFRELLVVFLFTQLVGKLATARTQNISLVVLAMVVGSALLGLAQYAFIGERVFVTFPDSWFISNAEKLPSQANLIYSYIRPSGPFGEPSYFAFVLVSFIFATLPILGSTVGRLTLLVCLLGIVISQSLSGYVASCGILLTYLVSRKSSYSYIVLLCAVLLLIGLFVSGVEIPVFNRLFNLADSRAEASGFVRVVAPLMVLPAFLMQHPFGVPYSALIQSLGGAAIPVGVVPGDLLNNGLFNLLFEFGFVGAVMIVILIRSTEGLVSRVYVTLAMLFNGSFLSFDKFAIVLIATMIFRGSVFERSVRVKSRRMALAGVSAQRRSAGNLGG